MDRFSRVTVALARAAIDEDVLRHAMRLRQLGSGTTRFDFVHVLPSLDSRSAMTVRSGELITHGDAVRSIRANVERLCGLRDDDRTFVVNGVDVDQLLEHAAASGSGLVLVGHRRGSTGRRSLGRRLAMKAPCSVLMVPEGSPPGINAIVAATDFSLPSAHALATATLIASRAGLHEVHALHVRAPSTLPEDDVEQESRDEAFERFLAPLDLHGVAVRRHLDESGSVTGATMRLAEERGADLVIMGTRGASPSTSVLLGSHSEEMLTRSSCPVLVTKDRGERIGVLQALLDRDFRSVQERRFG